MEYLNAFVCGGILCAIGQILIDKTKLTPAKILVSYVVAGRKGSHRQGRLDWHFHRRIYGGSRWCDSSDGFRLSVCNDFQVRG